MSYLNLHQISVILGHFRLQQISFSIESGQTLVILGPNGSGKTALLETVAGFNVPTEGKIELDGEDITLLPTEKREMGYVFQNYALFPHLTVEQNVSFGLHNSSDRQHRTVEMLDFLGIRRLAKRKTGKLSGGEKQRVALARALARNPKLFLFDEPLSSVDAAAREGLRDELRHFLRELKATSLYVTHDRTEALVLADILAIVRNGSIQQLGTGIEVFTSPANSWVAGFVGMQVLRPERVTFLDGRYAEVRIGGATLIARVRHTGEQNWMAAFQPEDVLITRRDSQSAESQNKIPLVIDKIIPLGPLIQVDLTGAVTMTTLVLRRQFSELNFSPGDAVNAQINAADLQLVPEAKPDVSES